MVTGRVSKANRSSSLRIVLPPFIISSLHHTSIFLSAFVPKHQQVTSPSSSSSSLTGLPLFQLQVRLYLTSVSLCVLSPVPETREAAGLEHRKDLL
ncbi:hypothetical protein GOODEAATRI_021308 [Goodea atripinnis]|uniref:Uncharacterized protein n=1 Tax=Goodea atripinnis TaxID=208336 RepID=A0ABV0MJK4_9TELE